ncbi:hypothetical protein Tco_0615638 [Tanacetum coccineum]
MSLSTHQGVQSTSTAAPSSSKIAASAEYSAWTTTDTRIKPSITTIPDDLYMDDETTADEQAYSSGDEVGRDHIPTVNLTQSWWKPFTEDRPATPEPAWTIPSSDLTMPTNNWASALKSTYAPPQLLRAQTGDYYGDIYGLVQLVSKPLPLVRVKPGHVTNSTDFFFNNDLEYLRYGRKRQIRGSDDMRSGSSMDGDGDTCSSGVSSPATCSHLHVSSKDIMTTGMTYNQFRTLDEVVS